MKPFTKSAMALGVATALTLTAATPSLARSRAWAAAGAGFVAGTVLGAAVANANTRYYNDGYDAYGYAPGPAYSSPGYDAYGYAPSYGPRYNYYSEGPNREDLNTGTGTGAIR